jgi:hypothetical protein
MQASNHRYDCAYAEDELCTRPAEQRVFIEEIVSTALITMEWLVCDVHVDALYAYALEHALVVREVQL